MSSKVQRCADRAPLIVGRASRPLAVRRGGNAHEWPARKTDRCGPGPLHLLQDSRLHIHGPLSGKSAATRLTNAATAASASSPVALISMMLSRAARNAMTFATLLALVHSAASDARMEICALNFLASFVSLTAGRACMPTSWTSRTLPVMFRPFAFDEVSNIFIPY